jgi:hypothetical protein
MISYVTLYSCIAVLTMLISRSYSGGACGRCQTSDRKSCPHATRWLTTILVSVAWFAVLAFAVMIVGRVIVRKLWRIGKGRL